MFEPSDAYELEKAIVECGVSQIVSVGQGLFEVDVKLMKKRNLRTGFLQDVKRTEIPPPCQVVVSAKEVSANQALIWCELISWLVGSLRIILTAVIWCEHLF
jgi:hypothetical protein